MPQARQPFLSVKEAISVLSSYGKQFSFPVTTASREQITQRLANRNIYRAFGNLPQKPSRLFPAWASQVFDDFIQKLATAKESDFNDIITSFANSLIDFWDDEIGINSQRIGFGPATKIVNLFVKSIQESEEFRMAHLFPLMHVPFDEYTIVPLREIVNDLTRIRYRISIPKKPSMSYVMMPELYNELQFVVKNLCDQAGTMPIVYEYLCWNEEH